MFLLIFLGILHAADVTFVNEVTTVAHENILLMDLASVSNLSPALEEKVLKTVIFTTQEALETLEISNLDLLKKVKPAVAAQATGASEMATNWVYFLPGKIRIKRTTSQISELRLQNLVKLDLQKKCPSCLIKSVTIKRPEMVGTLVSWSLDFQNIPVQKNFLVPLKMVKAPKTEETLWLNIQAGIFQEGFKTTALVSRDQRLGEKDVKKESIEIGNFKDRLATWEEIQTSRMNKSLSVNQPILLSDLQKDFFVNRGQVVKIISGSDQFEVSSQATAEDAGYFGDLIKLKSLDQKRTLSGIVIEKGLVRIQ